MRGFGVWKRGFLLCVLPIYMLVSGVGIRFEGCGAWFGGFLYLFSGFAVANAAVTGLDCRVNEFEFEVSQLGVCVCECGSEGFICFFGDCGLESGGC